jgi:hypothetical protein
VAIRRMPVRTVSLRGSLTGYTPATTRR